MAKDRPGLIIIDPGSSTVRALTAQPKPGGDVEVHSVGEAPSVGIQRGIVTDIDLASYSIRTALEEAGIAGKFRGAQVYALVGGKHLSSVNNTGTVHVARNDGLVTERDVERALEASRVDGLGPGAQVLHAFPRTFRLDGYRCRRNPIGMRGPTVGVESHLVGADELPLRNLRKAIQMAGKETDGLIAGPFAAAHAVLTPEEKEQGVVLVDIGGGSTGVVAFRNGVPFHTAVLPVGGNQLANDLGQALNTSTQVAEALYQEQGSGDPAHLDPKDELTVRCFGMTGVRILRRGFLNEVVRLRLGEIIGMAYHRAAGVDPNAALKAGMVLAGGMANLRGIETLATGTINTPVRIGRPVEEAVGEGRLADPGSCAVIGAVRLVAEAPAELLTSRRNGHTRGFRLLPQLQGPKPQAV